MFLIASQPKKSYRNIIGNTFKMTEHEIQVKLVNWFCYNYPDFTMFAIPNGSNKSGTQAMKFKREGLLSGVPDLFIIELNLFIELKTAKGKLSKEQFKIIGRIRAAGKQEVAVCRSFESARDEILKRISK
jgi:uncharacterized protein YktB (UPF0637 family)